VPYHSTERVDLPRTFWNAFYGYEEPVETVLQEHSPLAQASHMPDVSYLVVHGDADTAVNKEKHSDRFVAAMKAHKRRVDYVEVPGMGHSGPLPLAVIQKEIDFVLSHMKRYPRSNSLGKMGQENGRPVSPKDSVGAMRGAAKRSVASS